jgi:hypothetical protein
MDFLEVETQEVLESKEQLPVKLLLVEIEAEDGSYKRSFGCDAIEILDGVVELRCNIFDVLTINRFATAMLKNVRVLAESTDGPKGI